MQYYIFISIEHYILDHIDTVQKYTVHCRVKEYEILCTHTNAVELGLSSLWFWYRIKLRIYYYIAPSIKTVFLNHLLTKTALKYIS